jgi:hypothetical protein
MSDRQLSRLDLEAISSVEQVGHCWLSWKLPTRRAMKVTDWGLRSGTAAA